MSAEVYHIRTGRRLWEKEGRKFTAGRILHFAMREKLESVTIVGVTKDGEDYIASTHSNPADAVWDMEFGKLKLMGQGGDE